MFKLKVLVFSCLAFALFSCKSTRLDIVEPPPNYVKPVVNIQPSTIGIAININIPDLEKSLNASLSGLIYEDMDFDDDNMLVKVWKTGTIKFTVKNNIITYQLPIKIWYKTGFKKNVLGYIVEDYYEASGAMLLNMSSSFKLEKNWDLTTKTIVNTYEWTERPVIKAGGITIPVETLTNFIVFVFNSNILKSIDKKITEKVDLRTTMMGKWSEFHDPIHANADYDIWIKMQPKSLVATPISANGKEMKFGIGLNAIIESYVGIQPDSNKVKSPLPDFKTVQKIDPNFSIYSNIEVPFTKMTDIANIMVVGQEFTKGKKTVKIDSVLIWGQNEKLVVKASLSGSVKGNVYCLGTLNLIDSTQTLKIENFDFEMSTKNKLLKSANWLMHKGFLKKIEPMLTIPLNEQVDSMMTMTNELLSNYKYDKGMYLKGKLNKIQLQKITMTKDGFIISGKIDGEMRVDIKDWF